MKLGDPTAVHMQPRMSGVAACYSGGWPQVVSDVWLTRPLKSMSYAAYRWKHTVCPLNFNSKMPFRNVTRRVRCAGNDQLMRSFQLLLPLLADIY
jgi:hypothetical protein